MEKSWRKWLSALLLASHAWVPAYAQEPVLSAEQQYALCSQRAHRFPEETFKLARDWQQKGGGIPAQHCMALSLYGMRDYNGAARELEMILRSVSPAQGKLWLSIKAQVAKAYFHSQAYEPAENHLSEALRWASEHEADADMVPLLIQRSRIYTLHNENMRAINDLDHALSIQSDDEVLLERARVFIKIGKTESALDDIRGVLKRDPLNEDASALLGAVERRMKQLQKEIPAG